MLSFCGVVWDSTYIFAFHFIDYGLGTECRVPLVWRQCFIYRYVVCTYTTDEKEFGLRVAFRFVAVLVVCCVEYSYTTIQHLQLLLLQLLLWWVSSFEWKVKQTSWMVMISYCVKDHINNKTTTLLLDTNCCYLYNSWVLVVASETFFSYIHEERTISLSALEWWGAARMSSIFPWIARSSPRTLTEDYTPTMCRVVLVGGWGTKSQLFNKKIKYSYMRKANTTNNLYTTTKEPTLILIVVVFFSGGAVFVLRCCLVVIGTWSVVYLKKDNLSLSLNNKMMSKRNSLKSDTYQSSVKVSGDCTSHACSNVSYVSSAQWW